MPKNNICQECGMIVHPAEFHPFEFCVLVKNGYDPRDLYNRVVNHNENHDNNQ